MLLIDKKIKQIRKTFGFSQKQLAEVLNVSRQAITKWETIGGYPDLINLHKIARTFNITVDHITNDELELPILLLNIDIKIQKYNKLSHEQILNKIFKETYEIHYLLRKQKNMLIGNLVEYIILSIHKKLKIQNRTITNFLIIKDDIKLFAIFNSDALKVLPLSSETNKDKFTLVKNTYIDFGKINL